MKTIFTDTADLGSYAQLIDNSIEFDTLNSSFRCTTDIIIDTITKDVFDLIKVPTSDAHSFLKSAIANYVMADHLIFLSAKKNGSDQKLYKYQYEEIKEKYITLFWKAMDAILTYLDANPTIGKWEDSEVYKERKELFIMDAKDFDYFYGIANSQYFFTKVIFLIRKVQIDSIIPRLGEIDKIPENLKDIAKRALCFEVMAEAIKKFDATELPKSIRNDIAHEFSKDGTQMQVREKLIADLLKDVKKWHLEIERSMSLASGDSRVVVNHNEEENNFYTL